MIIFLIIKEHLSRAKIDLGHTVDCNSDTFGKSVAVCANKGGDFAQRVDLEIVLGYTFCWLSRYDLKV